MQTITTATTQNLCQRLKWFDANWLYAPAATNIYNYWFSITFTNRRIHSVGALVPCLSSSGFAGTFKAIIIFFLIHELFMLDYEQFVCYVQWAQFQSNCTFIIHNRNVESIASIVSKRLMFMMRLSVRKKYFLLILI